MTLTRILLYMQLASIAFFVLYAARWVIYPHPIREPHWVYVCWRRAYRYWRRYKKAMLHCTILAIGVIASLLLFWFLDAHGLNNTRR